MHAQARTLVQDPQQSVVRLQVQRAAARAAQQELVAPRTVGRRVHEHIVLQQHGAARAGFFRVAGPEGRREVVAVGALERCELVCGLRVGFCVNTQVCA